MSTNMAKQDRDTRKKFILSFLERGQIASLEFKKADNSLRKATVKLFVEKGFTSGSRDDVQANPVAHKPEHVTCYDIQGNKWINVNVDKLVKAKLGGEEYSWEE